MSPSGRSGHKTITRKNVLFAGSDRTVATLQTAKMNDVETPLSPLSYLVAFKTFLLVPPRINNDVPRCSRRDHFFIAPTHQARFHGGVHA